MGFWGVFNPTGAMVLKFIKRPLYAMSGTLNGQLNGYIITLEFLTLLEIVDKL